MAYESPKPHIPPKLHPPRGEVVAVVLLTALALALVLGASLAVWALQG